jgi:hypothetical protein
MEILRIVASGAWVSAWSREVKITQNNLKHLELTQNGVLEYWRGGMGWWSGGVVE